MKTVLLRPRFAVIVVALILLSASCARQTGSSGSPRLTIMYNAEEQPTEKNTVAQILQSQLKDHGIDVRLDPVPNSVFYDRIAKGEFQAALALWYLDYNDPEGFLTDFYSKASFRMSKYDNPLYDKAYLAGLYAPDEAEKIQQFRKAVAILSTDLPWVPLYSNDEIFLLRKGAEGFESNAYQYYDYRQVALDHIRAASDVAVQTLDPALVYDLGSKHIVTQSYEGLVTMNDKLKIVPALASQWKWSKDKDAITFRLRPNVLFQNASIFTSESQRVMTAEDVRFSFERLLKSNSPYTYIFDYVKGVKAFKAGKAPHVSGFVVVDKHTFTIELTRPFPTMLPWLLAPAADILPRELPPNYDFTRGSVGTGPFILNSFDGTVARFSTNPDYWGRSPDGRRLPFAKTLTIRVIEDPNTLLAAFRQDQLDVMDVPLALFNQVFEPNGTLRPEWKQYDFREVTLNNLNFLAFNMRAAPWGTHVDLRRKVSDAFNRQDIVQKVFEGKARVATSVIPSGVAGFD